MHPGKHLIRPYPIPNHKHSFPPCAALVLAWIAGTAFAANAAEIAAPAKEEGATDAPALVEAGAHYRVWKNGESTVTELADGLNYFDGVSWQPTEEKIEALPDGSAAVANKGQFRASFSPNINTAGGITLLTPDNKTFKSHIAGLVYADWAAGKSVIVAL